MMERSVASETCVGCAFDASRYTRPELLRTLLALAPMWRMTTEPVDDESVFAARPAPEVWSALEYAAHSRDIVGAMGYLIHLALTRDDVVLPPAPAPDDLGPPSLPPTLALAIAELDANVGRLTNECQGLAGDAWRRTITLGDETTDVEGLVAHAVHDSVHHLRDVGRGLTALGWGAPRQEGSVVQVSTSDGGVPKAAHRSIEVDAGGVVGDRQNDRKHHGAPLQALCLWSLEVIDALRAEGHPIFPGAAGENVTVSGIDWTTIRPGVRVQIGDVVAEISAFAVPCAKNAPWFADRAFRRMDHDRHPGWSRAYAWVLAPGVIAPGDGVFVEP
jgi:hypothetical protein